MSPVATFRTELAKASSEPVAFYDASLDAGNESASEDPQLLIDVLRRRFARSAPDLVVTIGPPAAAFYIRNRDQVFGATPLLIAAVDEAGPTSALRAGTPSSPCTTTFPD